MNIEWIRKYCLSLPHTTEKIQWQDDLVFKVGGKMYAVVVLIPAPVWMSFKSSAEEFAELVEQPGVIPAPYLARAQWVALTADCALPQAEIKRLLRQAHDLVLAKLPKKMQAAMLKTPVRKTRSGRAKRQPR
ncbi:MAG TPA: MmcQ/YjbR family DNA-binding protein [Terriglobia bacterium]|nr:MmcQ/YjbR family DNA-binding protein [Terriglobia bacterium]